MPRIVQQVPPPITKEPPSDGACPPNPPPQTPSKPSEPLKNKEKKTKDKKPKQETKATTAAQGTAHPSIQPPPLVPRPFVGGASARPVDVSRLDMRIGRILSVKKHPDADTLYVEESGWSLVCRVTAASLPRSPVQLI